MGAAMAYTGERQSLEPKDDRHPVSEKQQKRNLLAELVSDGARPSGDASSAEIVVYPYGAPVSRQPVGGGAKRAFDLIFVVLISLLAAPLLILLALATKMLSDGPVLFGHKRIGFQGREFICLKFRTMVVDGDKKLAEYLAANHEAAKEWAESQKLRNDPRITTIGRFLRKTSLDELPQLLNILRGDMSLVGPRPVVAEELERYGPRRPAYLSARPGMSGLWQVSGRNATSYERRTELDEIYVQHWSMMRDVEIILRTIPEMLPSSRAY
jgi:exopolysaccharide production protein ExoY